MSDLPIDQYLDQLKTVLASSNRLLLIAQPGAGKTTRVPLCLLEEDWVKGQRLLLLEPRRVAARLAACYMAQQLGESVGQTVGYRMRGDSCVSAQTRLEVVTQGVLTRMLQADPLLEGIAGIIFDEFHERSLEADVGLALMLDVQTSIRDDLRLLVMSATLDVEALKRVLGGPVPVIECHGRQFPVTTAYRPALSGEESVSHALRVIEEALSMPGTQDILVILPGVAEINRLVQLLEKMLPDLAIRRLHGRMSIAEQQAALAANTSKQRIIVSTAITESSITVDGVNVVIDGGLERVPLFQPRTGLTRLTTRRINRASADQRRGRAGRQREGSCFRLWAQEQTLVPYGEPEILQADLSSLVLELACWGVASPQALSWVTPPPEGAWRGGQSLLVQLGVLDEYYKLTPLGNRCARWPVEPRIAVMLERASDFNVLPLACGMAALLEERDSSERSLHDALALRVRQPKRFPSWQREALRLAKIAGIALSDAVLEPLGPLLALAYPERIGQQMDSGIFRLANGKTATLPLNDMLAHQSFLVAVALHSTVGGQTRIITGEPLSLESLLSLYPGIQKWQPRVAWSQEQGRLIGEEVQAHASLVIAKRPLVHLPEEAVKEALLNALRQQPGRLFGDNLQQMRGRMALLRDNLGEAWPDWSEPALLASLESWLAPYLIGIKRLSQIEKLPLERYLLNSLTWEAQSEFEQLTPLMLEVPSGKQVGLDYQPCLSQRPPILALKLQEAFGWRVTPTVLNGTVAVMIHLLSPARRPLQVTQDLVSFWQNGYPEVRKEMRGRYPKHPWPEDPLTAPATAQTRRKV
ncbi:ATP-dependent helicase HrpB [Vreelandella boliviensis]|uniref:ATP-dependent RNA helicase hrpB n=1 Tax=Vreelandella boliviensis LC1 TaxID=1072583 RepID=A0A265DUC3_9GAMM|nr:ATP-dependent helicase HrpB [Halomonas boliviensis]EHJ91872.1 ATP-dependent RNA helicase hrpB [Halomonas boliviensis LC1]OZT72921.1 ATP-dependent helicase HrpB [Halomonas boliviensis LC1]